MALCFLKSASVAAQIIALSLAFVGVVVQGFALGAPPPDIALLCARHGQSMRVIRKQAAVPAATGLFVETLVLVPVAIGLLYWVTLSEPLAIAESVGHGVLIALAGPRHSAAAVAIRFRCAARFVHGARPDAE